MVQGAPRTKNELVEPPQSVDDDDILHPISTSEPLTGPIGHVSSFIVESPSQGTVAQLFFKCRTSAVNRGVSCEGMR